LLPPTRYDVCGVTPMLCGPGSGDRGLHPGKSDDKVRERGAGGGGNPAATGRVPGVPEEPGGAAAPAGGPPRHGGGGTEAARGGGSRGRGSPGAEGGGPGGLEGGCGSAFEVHNWWCGVGRGGCKKTRLQRSARKRFFARLEFLARFEARPGSSANFGPVGCPSGAGVPSSPRCIIPPWSPIPRE